MTSPFSMTYVVVARAVIVGVENERERKPGQRAKESLRWESKHLSLIRPTTRDRGIRKGLGSFRSNSLFRCLGNSTEKIRDTSVLEGPIGRIKG